MNEENLSEESLRTLARATAALPREIAPPPDVWNKIRDVIESDRGVDLGSRRGRWWQRPAVLAAAGVLLVAGSSIVTAIAMRSRAEGAPEKAHVATIDAATGSSPQSLAQFTALENDYIGTANRLTEILESEQTELAPETVVKLRESLRIIDAAILEARRALAQDPSNKTLMEMLSASYSQKVDLLRRTTEMGRS